MYHDVLINHISMYISVIQSRGGWPGERERPTHFCHVFSMLPTLAADWPASSLHRQAGEEDKYQMRHVPMQC